MQTKFGSINAEIAEHNSCNVQSFQNTFDENADQEGELNVRSITSNPNVQNILKYSRQASERALGKGSRMKKSASKRAREFMEFSKHKGFRIRDAAMRRLHSLKRGFQKEGAFLKRGSKKEGRYLKRGFMKEFNYLKNGAKKELRYLTPR